MWVKNLALRLAADGIGVFEVRPGIIRTDMTAGVTAKYDALIDGGLVPTRRWGEAARHRRGGRRACRRHARLRHRLGHQCRRRAVGAEAVKGVTMTDYIIVGAGPAGCVLANRLSEDPAISVLLLEAGGSDWHPLIHMPAGFAKMTKGIASWGWSTVPQKHMKDRVFRYTQAKVIGGGSSINAQIYTRGNARDYDAWEKRGGLRRLGLSRRAALFQARREQRALRQRLSRRSAGRSASPTRSRRCRSARPISAPARRWASPSTRTSTAPARKASATTS